MVLLNEPMIDPGAESMPEWAAAFLVFYLLFIFIALALGVACYILQSLGMYTIAERRGIRQPWLAWVPLANVWVLGSISDQYQYLTKGKIKNRRKVLLALVILEAVAYFAMLVGIVIAAIAATDEMPLGSALTMVFGSLAVLAVAIALCVIMYMCYYDLFCSCEPGSAVLYLVLSIIISGALPIVVFICRKKDLGMPKRKEPNAQPVQIPEEPVAVETEAAAEEAPAAEEPQEPSPTEEGYANPEEFVDEENT